MKQYHWTLTLLHESIIHGSLTFGFLVCLCIHELHVWGCYQAAFLLKLTVPFLNVS